MNEGKKKRIFVLLWILIIMMTYYSTTNINFSEQNVTKNKMEILEKAQSPKEIYSEYSNAIVHAFQKFKAPFSGKIVHIFPEQSAVI